MTSPVMKLFIKPAVDNAVSSFSRKESLESVASPLPSCSSSHSLSDESHDPELRKRSETIFRPKSSPKMARQASPNFL